MDHYSKKYVSRIEEFHPLLNTSFQFEIPKAQDVLVSSVAARFGRFSLGLRGLRGYSI